MPAHEDDPLGSQPPRREHGRETDRTVANHRHSLARRDPPHMCSVMTGEIDVRQGEEGGQQCTVSIDARHRQEAAVRLGRPSKFRLEPAGLGSTVIAACRQDVWSPSWQKTQVLSWYVKVAMTKSPL
jgi:hypothetical protein